ncbi:metal-transporting ATPase PfeT [soil metagenome]
MRNVWTKHGEAITTAICAAFVVLGFLVARNGGSTGLSTGLFLVGYVAGGYRQAIEGTTRLVVKRELDVDLLMVVAAIGAAGIGYWFDGALLIFIFALSGTLEGYASARTQRDIESLMSLNPEEATVLRVTGEEERVPVDALSVGDIVLVKPGERVPADGQIIDGASLIDQASITGEATPVHRQIGDEVFAGTINGQGGLRVKVSKPAGETVLARIIATVRDAQERRPPAQLFIEKFERIYANVVVLGAILFVVVPIFVLGWTFADAWYRAMVFLVVASPCALAASMMPALLSALSNGARNGVLFKGSTYVEALGKVRAVAFDKTGTLTTGRPSVVEVLGADGADVAALLSRSAAVEAMSEHPVGAAIVDEARRRNCSSSLASNFQATVGVGASASVDGSRWNVGKAEMFSVIPEPLRAAKDRLESAGDTVVLVGDHTAHGVIAMRDTIRPNAAEAVQALRRLGIEHVVVLTGDSEGPARTVASAIGADQVHSGLLPDDKVRIVEELLARYGSVAVVGDGVNDAPALATATVGIAMGAGGTDVALDTADVVLMADDVGRIPYAIQLGRRALRIVKQNVVVAVSVMVLLVFADVLGRISLPAGVVGHEGSTLLVTVSGLRLLLQLRS